MHTVINNIRVPLIIKPLWWQLQGLSYTSTGYGSKIPTRYMVKWQGKWRRVYIRIYGNIGTCYIGKIADGLFMNHVIED